MVVDEVSEDHLHWHRLFLKDFKGPGTLLEVLAILPHECPEGVLSKGEVDRL